MVRFGVREQGGTIQSKIFICVVSSLLLKITSILFSLHPTKQPSIGPRPSLPDLSPLIPKEKNKALTAGSHLSMYLLNKNKRKYGIRRWPAASRSRSRRGRAHGLAGLGAFDAGEHGEPFGGGGACYWPPERRRWPCPAAAAHRCASRRRTRAGGGWGRGLDGPAAHPRRVGGDG